MIKELDRIVVVNTLACNFQCPGCLREFNRSDHLPLDLYKKAVTQGVQAGVQHISFTGGEPCMHPDFDEMVEFAIYHKLQVTSVTNGWLASRYSRLLTYARGGLTVSLDGATPAVHDRARRAGSFERAVALINDATELGKTPHVTTVFSKINAHQAQALGELLTRLGVRSITLAGLIKTSYNLDMRLTPNEYLGIIHELSKFKFKIKAPKCFNYNPERTCTLVRNRTRGRGLAPVVTPHGDWAFCCDLPQDLGRPIGSVNNMSLAEARSEMQRLSEEFYKVPVWNCDDCADYFDKPLTVDSAPKHKIISLVPIK